MVLFCSLAVCTRNELTAACRHAHVAGGCPGRPPGHPEAMPARHSTAVPDPPGCCRRAVHQAPAAPVQTWEVRGPGLHPSPQGAEPGHVSAGHPPPSVEQGEQLLCSEPVQGAALPSRLLCCHSLSSPLQVTGPFLSIATLRCRPLRYLSPSTCCL